MSTKPTQYLSKATVKKALMPKQFRFVSRIHSWFLAGIEAYVNALGSQTASVSAVYCLKLVFVYFSLNQATINALTLTCFNPSCINNE